MREISWLAENRLAWPTRKVRPFPAPDFHKTHKRPKTLCVDILNGISYQRDINMENNLLGSDYSVTIHHTFSCRSRGTAQDRPWVYHEFEAPTLPEIRHMKLVSLSTLWTGRLYPTVNIPGTHFSYKYQSKIPMTPSGIEHATFWFVANCNQLHHRVSLTSSCPKPKSITNDLSDKVRELWYVDIQNPA
jgi:hypothetical protein